jgi:uncharacterized membrane protein YgcG
MFFRTTATVLAVSGLSFFMSVSGQAQTAVSTAPATQSTATPTSSRLTADYTVFAGSTSNATALVNGMRNGTSVTLTASSTSTGSTPPPATFTPVTGKLGNGEINIALSLAKADLAKQGITNPTPAQLAAALNGGTMTTATTTVSMKGILAQRESGMGWGQIANAMGVKLGSLVSASKTDKAGKKSDDDAGSQASNKNKGREDGNESHNSKMTGAGEHAGGNGSGSGGRGSHGGGGGGGKK